MAPRITPLRNPALAFAHRGARAHAPENTIEAFRLALQMGATGLESDVWITGDGIPVLDHDGWASRLRRKAIRSVNRTDLPEHIPTMREFYAMCGTDFDVSLDIKDPAAAEATVDAMDAIAVDLGVDVRPRMWFCHPDFDQLVEWHELWPDINMVHSTRLDRLKHGPERHGAELAEAGIACVNMRQPDWTGGLTTLFHRFGIHCFAWDVQLDRNLAEILDMGVDGLYSDHVDRMMSAHAAAYLKP